MKTTNVRASTKRSDSTRMPGVFDRLSGIGWGADGTRKSPLLGGDGGVTGFSLAAGVVCFKGGGGGTATVGGSASGFFCHSYILGGRGAEPARETFSLSSLLPGVVF